MTTQKTDWLKKQLDELCDEITGGDRQEAYVLLIAERLVNISAELYEHRTMMGEVCRALREISKDMYQP